MAQLKIIIGGGNPSQTVDLGTDEEAIQMMREALQGSPRRFVDLSPDVQPEEPPTPINWTTAAVKDVVEAFADQLARSGRRLARRGRRV